MTDKELLELAATAAGIDTSKVGAISGLYLGVYGWWNPLTDDGDALRLAVKLGMLLTLKGSQSMHPPVLAEIALHGTIYVNAAFEEQPDDGNPYAAIRRAIVRAAAEIGKETE